MGVITKTENALDDLGETLLFLLIVGLAVVTWFAWKGFSWPYALYPQTLWSEFATSIDGFFSSLKQSPFVPAKVVDSWSKAADDWLSGVYGWITDNLPNTPESKMPPSDGSSATQIAGTDVGTGTDVQDYTPSGGGDQ